MHVRVFMGVLEHARLLCSLFVERSVFTCSTWPSESTHASGKGLFVCL
jgi:hypothetical protein